MAIVLLSLAVVSRAPQSKCRCHERRGSSRSQTQDQKPCVFGQMRSMTASYVLPATIAVEEKAPLAWIPIVHSSLEGVSYQAGISDYPRARSPPVIS
jgi:hypothetical protein